MQAIPLETLIEANMEEITDRGIDPDLLQAFVENEHITDLEEALDRFEDCYAGTYNNVEAWAAYHLDQTGELNGLPELMQLYFDYSKYARDCERGGTIYSIEINGDTAVFWNR